MVKKQVGKGLKELIPDHSNKGEVEAQVNPPADDISGSSAQGAQDVEEVLTMPNPVIDREPDPFFVENLKKEREKRVKAIAAMNELINKYNTD